VPTKSRPLVLRRVTISEEQGELECFRQPDALEFRGCGESLGRVAPIECSAEAVVSRALGSHERMFARRPSALEGKIRPTRKPSLVYDEAVRPTSVEQLEQRAFTSEKVRALTGLTPRQLQYWDEQKFLSPSLRRRRGKGRRRLYDFRDLVSLRVAADLRREGVSLQLIRRAVEHLRGLDYQHPLSELRFWQVDGKLYFEEARTVREARRPAQTIAWFAVPLGEIVAELEQGIVQLDRRQHGQIERRRGVLGSKPLIAGTRIPVESVHRLRADGADQREILRLYPDLTAEDVQAALAEEPRPRRKRAS